jgi:hypothetical protein
MPMLMPTSSSSVGLNPPRTIVIMSNHVQQQQPQVNGMPQDLTKTSAAISTTTRCQSQKLFFVEVDDLDKIS